MFDKGNKSNSRISQKTLQDICGCKGMGGENGYCTLIELIKMSGMTDRVLEQYKCIEIFKYSRGIGGEDNGWNQAAKVWVEEGHAKRFSEVYSDGMTSLEIYNKLFPRNS